MIEWNIQSRAHACQACQKAFSDQEGFHTLLYDHKHAYERLDVCESCWSAQFANGATERKDFLSHWAGVYAAPPAAPPDPIGKETAESLLRKLIEENDPAHAAARFILAVMLERKRLLKVKAQLNEGGQRTFVYEHSKTGDLFSIADPNLQLHQLDAVQRDVARLLEQGPSETPSPLAEPGGPVEPATGGNAGDGPSAPPESVPGLPQETAATS